MPRTLELQKGANGTVAVLVEVVEADKEAIGAKSYALIVFGSFAFLPRTLPPQFREASIFKKFKLKLV